MADWIDNNLVIIGTNCKKDNPEEMKKTVNFITKGNWIEKQGDDRVTINDPLSGGMSTKKELENGIVKFQSAYEPPSKALKKMSKTFPKMTFLDVYDDIDGKKMIVGCNNGKCHYGSIIGFIKVLPKMEKECPIFKKVEKVI